MPPATNGCARSRPSAARNDTVQLGIGVSSYVEITGGGDGEYGSIEVRGDGSAVVRTGTSAHGQGHDTAFAMLASARTGIPFERVEVRHGDTDDVPRQRHRRFAIIADGRSGD